MEIVQVLLHWLNVPNAAGCWSTAQLYGQLRQVCKLESIPGLQQISLDVASIWPNGLHDYANRFGWCLYYMCRFNKQHSLPFWTPYAPQADAAEAGGYVAGKGDELLGARWRGDAVLRLRHDGALVELSTPFELEFPYTTGWKHSDSGQVLWVEGPAPRDLEFKWCIVDQRYTLEEAKRAHARKLALVSRQLRPATRPSHVNE